MKKFINNVDDFLKESLNGFGKAHSDIIAVNFEPNFISRKSKTKQGKVSLISGGGSGHCLLYTSPSPRDGFTSRMPSSA